MTSSNWQPIETAPRDGRTILLYSSDGITQGAWYTYGVGCEHMSRFRPLWLDEHGCGCCSGDNYDPTHWQPLPPPPDTKDAV